MSPTAEGRAAAYARDTLGVDKVYDAANAGHNALADALGRLTEAARERRRVDAEILDNEIEIASIERGKHTDLSQAAFERHLKEVLHNAVQLVELRQERAELHAQYEQADADAEIARSRVRIECARMEELGGLLDFYAWTKAATLTPPTTP